MEDEKINLLEKRGWPAERIARLRRCDNIKPRKDLSLIQFGELLAIEPFGHLDEEIVWACKCSCGQKALKTSKELTAGFHPHCGCLAEGEGYEFWEKNIVRLHAV